MEINPDKAREMGLLEQIEHDPNVSQATLAAQLGVAVGTVNWHLKRLIEKGYVKVKRAERRKLKYIITPEGIAFRARLTVDYIEQSMLLYRRTRKQVGELVDLARRKGLDTLCIEGEGDIADICRLTCIEQGLKVAADGDARAALVVRGTKVSLRLDGDGRTDGGLRVENTGAGRSLPQEAK